MTNKQLADIEARANAATPGPWNPSWDGSVLSEHDNIADVWSNNPADCKFIAHAHEDIPLLLEEVKRLRKLIDEHHVAGYVTAGTLCTPCTMDNA